MSIRAWTWAFDAVDNASFTAAREKLVLLALADYAGEDDTTWRSRQEIAKRALCGIRSVDGYLKALEQKGLISRTRYSKTCLNPKCGLASRGAHTHPAGTIYKLHLSVTSAQTTCDSSTQGDSPATLGDPDALVAKFATKAELLESREVPHSRKNCNYGGEDGTIVATGGSPYSQPTATVLKGINLQLNPHPDLTLMADADSDGLVGSGNDAASVVAVDAARPADSESGFRAVVDRGLISECLPMALQALDAQGATRVVELLRERVDAGWKPSDIRVLMDRPLPEKVHRLSALVAKRLETNVDPALAPAPVEAKPVVRVEAVKQVPEPWKTAWESLVYEPIWYAEVAAAGNDYMAAFRATQTRVASSSPSAEAFEDAWISEARSRDDHAERPAKWWSDNPEALLERGRIVLSRCMTTTSKGVA